jgi:hypothetical protein
VRVGVGEGVIVGVAVLVWVGVKVGVTVGEVVGVWVGVGLAKRVKLAIWQPVSISTPRVVISVNAVSVLSILFGAVG